MAQPIGGEPITALLRTLHSVLDEQREVSQDLFDQLATIGGTDADEVVIRTGWRKALEEFPIGTRVGVQMNRSRPADAPPPPA